MEECPWVVLWRGLSHCLVHHGVVGGRCTNVDEAELVNDALDVVTEKVGVVRLIAGVGGLMEEALAPTDDGVVGDSKPVGVGSCVGDKRNDLSMKRLLEKVHRLVLGLVEKPVRELILRRNGYAGAKKL